MHMTIVMPISLCMPNYIDNANANILLFQMQYFAFWEWTFALQILPAETRLAAYRRLRIQISIYVLFHNTYFNAISSNYESLMMFCLWKNLVIRKFHVFQTNVKRHYINTTSSNQTPRDDNDTSSTWVQSLHMLKNATSNIVLPLIYSGIWNWRPAGRILLF